jgi:hypothetical protein
MTLVALGACVLIGCSVGESGTRSPDVRATAEILANDFRTATAFARPLETPQLPPFNDGALPAASVSALPSPPPDALTPTVANRSGPANGVLFVGGLNYRSDELDELFGDLKAHLVKDFGWRPDDFAYFSYWQNEVASCAWRGNEYSRLDTTYRANGHSRELDAGLRELAKSCPERRLALVGHDIGGNFVVGLGAYHPNVVTG